MRAIRDSMCNVLFFLTATGINTFERRWDAGSSMKRFEVGGKVHPVPAAGCRADRGGGPVRPRHPGGRPRGLPSPGARREGLGGFWANTNSPASLKSEVAGPLNVDSLCLCVRRHTLGPAGECWSLWTNYFFILSQPPFTTQGSRLPPPPRWGWVPHVKVQQL